MSKFKRRAERLIFFVDGIDRKVHFFQKFFLSTRSICVTQLEMHYRNRSQRAKTVINTIIEFYLARLTTVGMRAVFIW